MISFDANGDGALDDLNDATYAYDSDGNRVNKTVIKNVDDELTPVPTYYLVDPNNTTGYAKAIEEKFALGAVPIRTYILGHDVIAQQGKTSSTLRYLQRDGHGTTRLLTTTAGSNGNVIVASTAYEFDAFGNAINGTVSNTSPATVWLAPDGTFDVETGLTYQNFRYSERRTGRFVSADDGVSGSSGDPTSLHLYTYALGNPLAYLDPGGHFSISELGINMGNMAKNFADKATATYNVYDKANTIRDVSRFVAQIARGAPFDAIAALSLAAQFFPWGTAFKGIKFIGGKAGVLTGEAGSALTSFYQRAKGLDKIGLTQLIGETGAAFVAKAKNFVPTSFVAKYHGIDSIFKDQFGNFIVVEAKGGASALAEGQMSQKWIRS